MTLYCIYSHLSPFFLVFNYCPACVYRHIARCVFTTIIMNKVSGVNRTDSVAGSRQILER